MTDEDDVDLDKIVHDAVLSTNSSVPPRPEMTLRLRLLLILGAMIIVANTVVSIYNSLALREEVNCNHQLQQALNVVGDQNRHITKDIIDYALTPGHTFEELVAERQRYDEKFRGNSSKRSTLLQTTCNEGPGTSTTTVAPSK